MKCSFKSAQKLIFVIFPGELFLHLCLIKQSNINITMSEKETVDLNPGEIKVHFKEAHKGKVTFAELGLKDEDLVLESGHLRLVFDLEGMGDHKYYSHPTLEFGYVENMPETHWQVDFNENTILDKHDHYGHSTVCLLSKAKIEESEHHHVNKLVVHAEFPKAAHLLADKSYINLFK